MLTYDKYNDEKLAVRGDRAKYQRLLKPLGARWNSRMRGGEGWLVPIKKKRALQKIISDLKKEEALLEIEATSKSKNPESGYHREDSGQSGSESDDSTDEMVRATMEALLAYDPVNVQSRSPEHVSSPSPEYAPITQEAPQEETPLLELELELESDSLPDLASEKIEVDDDSEEEILRQEEECRRAEEAREEEARREEEAKEEEARREAERKALKRAQEEHSQEQKKRSQIEARKAYEAEEAQKVKEIRRAKKRELKERIAQLERDKAARRKKREEERKTQRNPMEYYHSFSKKPSSFREMYSRSPGEVYSSSEEDHSESSEDDFPSPSTPRRRDSNHAELFRKLQEMRERLHDMEKQNRRLRRKQAR